MSEPRILSVCWLPREQLKDKPDKVEIKDDQLIDIVQNADVDDDTSENELEEDTESEMISEEKKKDRPVMTEEDEKIWDEFKLDDYDEEDDDLLLKIGSLVDQGNNEDGYDPTVGEDSDEDDDITLKREDHILLAGTDGNDGTAAVEVRIFNTNEEYYVRNDISLSGPPLCLCYVNTEIGEVIDDDGDAKAEYSSNFVAIGSITNEIQIWDLDVMDSPGPSYTLTGHRQSSAVISLSWDGDRHLVSGGSDGRSLLWSLDNGAKVALGKESNENAINQIVFATKSRIISGDSTGVCRIYDKTSECWSCVKEVTVGDEIEKICSNSHLFAIGTSKGVIHLFSQSNLEMTVRWMAYQPEQPITALEFKTDYFLFSAGHEPASDLIIWNVSKHQTSENSTQIPLAQYKRRLHKQGRTFCAALCPLKESDLVLIGGETGGPQVLKVTQKSKKIDSDDDDDDSDSEDEEEEEDEDKAEMTTIKDEEWETDSGSSDGEQIIDELEDAN